MADDYDPPEEGYNPFCFIPSDTPSDKPPRRYQGDKSDDESLTHVMSILLIGACMDSVTKLQLISQGNRTDVLYDNAYKDTIPIEFKPLYEKAKELAGIDFTDEGTFQFDFGEKRHTVTVKPFPAEQGEGLEMLIE
jgi:hypothetical protein